MKVLLCGDFHCGSDVGLTPPQWQENEHQQEMWSKFRRRINECGPFDFAVFNGDLIDGKQRREGGRGAVTVDRLEQIEMAKQVVDVVSFKNALLTRGTPYHVGVDEDFEDGLAKRLDLPIYGHAFPRIEGVNFSIRHFIAGSIVPYGRFTAIARDKEWNRIWAIEKENQPISNILVRSHVHYYLDCGRQMSKGNDWWRGFVLPALQGTGTRYGETQCIGTIDYGFVWLELDNGKLVKWQAEIIPLKHGKVKVPVYE